MLRNALEVNKVRYQPLAKSFFTLNNLFVNERKSYHAYGRVVRGKRVGSGDERSEMPYGRQISLDVSGLLALGLR